MIQPHLSHVGWKLHRRLLQAHFHPNMAKEYQPIHVWANRLFLRNVLDQSEELKSLIRECAHLLLMTDVVLKLAPQD
jgi:hypothetical protein